MNADENAVKIFNQIAHGRESERMAALSFLDDPLQPIDRQLLRERIMQAVDGKYAVGQEVMEKDISIMWTRSWLVNALGRICKGDRHAEKFVRRHLDYTYEEGWWVRYWAMESLIKTEADDLLQLAEAGRKDHDPLVTMLASAVIATRGPKEEGEEALAEIEAALGTKVRRKTRDNGEEEYLEHTPVTWHALRALRVVPIPRMFDRLQEIVRQGKNHDTTYDAIVALSAATPSSPHAAAAAGVLTDFLRRNRSSAWYDGMRTAALGALGRLKAESAATVILEELSDDNPAVARAAAVALKEVVGIRTAAARVVEAASKTGPERAETLARALRWMERDAVVEELESVMVSGRPEHQEAARLLLSEIGGFAAMQKLRARTSAVAQYSAEMEKAEEKIRNLFETTIAEARAGFKLASMMDVAVFVIGLALVGVSAGIILARGGDLNSWAGIGLTGGTGVLGVVYGILIARPRKQILEAVDHLMHLKVVFLAYLRQLHQVDQAYTRRLLEDKPLGSEEAAQYSHMADATMRAAVEQMLAVREHPPRGRAAAGRHETERRAHAEAAAGNGKVGKGEGASVN
jgi:hypothetical protein